MLGYHFVFLFWGNWQVKNVLEQGGGKLFWRAEQLLDFLLPEESRTLFLTQRARQNSSLTAQFWHWSNKCSSTVLSITNLTAEMKWNPYLPTLLPWCPGFQTLDICVATSYRPDFAHPLLKPHGHFPKNISPWWILITEPTLVRPEQTQVFSAQEVSHFNPGGTCLDNQCHKTSSTRLSALKAWAHVGASSSCMTWAEAWNVILQEKVQLFH